MATFSENQVRQLYVVKTLKATALAATDTAGTAYVTSNTSNNSLYINYMGAGGVSRSDVVDTSKILWCNYTVADEMRHPLKRYKLVLDSTVNGGAPIAGQDYILRIDIRNFIGLSDEDQYQKFGMVHASAAMTASAFYVKLAESLVKNFSREVSTLLKFYLADATSTTEVNTATGFSGLAGTYTGIILEEAPQEWILGVMPQNPISFTVHPTTVTSNGDEVIWGTVTDEAAVNYITDGKKIADLEYFLMGERGDNYRMMGFPNVIRTTYLADATQDYDLVDLHYYFNDDNQAVQKSEKTITLAFIKGTDITALITTLKTACAVSGVKVLKAGKEIAAA